MFQKTTRFLDTWKQTKDMNLKTIFFSYALLHMNLQKYKNWFGHLIGANPKRHKYWGQNSKKWSMEKTKKLNFLQFFEFYIFGSANPRKMFDKFKLLQVGY